MLGDISTLAMFANNLDEYFQSCMVRIVKTIDISRILEEFQTNWHRYCYFIGCLLN